MKWCVILFLFLLVSGVAGYFALRWLSIDCSDEILADVLSPDTKYVATLFERNCGATTDFSTIVSLRQTTQNFDAEKHRIFVLAGRSVVKMQWADDFNLKILHNSSPDDIFLAEKRIDLVSITYGF